MIRAAIVGLGRWGQNLVEGGRPFACPPEDAIHGVAVLEAIVRSVQSGRREVIGRRVSSL